MSIKPAVLGIVAFSLSVALADTAGVVATNPVLKPAPCRVLVVSGQSDLEAAVVKRLAELLRTDSIAVHRIAIAEVQHFHPEKFTATILMSAIDKNHLKKEMQDFVNRYGHLNDPATVIIAKVNGAELNEKGTEIDAVTQASATLEPSHIAQRLYKKVLGIISKGAR
jgi:hypothetical protein